MGELFERVVPRQHLDWTGERLTTEASGQVEVEHLHRYFLARAFVRGLDVLDIAAGEGYGSAFLAQTARTVVGVDIDAAAMAHASVAYAGDNLRFECGSAQAIPVADQTIDVVVSFETIEHFYEQEQFLREIKRVLRPGGRLIVSSPDRDHYSPLGGPSNKYHVRELTKGEFEQLLAEHFKFVSLMGQRPIVGSVIVREETAQAAPPLTFERRGEVRFEASPSFDRPLYHVAVASDAPLPGLPQSFYFERASVDDATVTLPAVRAEYSRQAQRLRESEAAAVGRADRIAQLEDDLAERTAEISAREQRQASEIDALRAACRAGEIERARLEDFLSERTARLTQVEERLSRIRRSTLYWPLWLAVKIESEIRRVWRRLQRGPGRDGSPQFAGGQIASGPAAVPVSLGPIELPLAPPRPDVSVVILSYGHTDHTLACLRSIARALPACTVEFVVSDDCSGATDIDELRRIEHLRLLSPPENLGFVRHANWAVAQTAGAHVLLLNNDTELAPGAIDSLLETARLTPDIGLVGSKLVYPDGRLQEAGGIVWNDASAWNFGRNDNPEKPEYNYVRDADYISGASILVPREVWDRLGGFDTIFAPAYCEDADFAFRLRQQGLRVIYQPLSVVVHHEGVSHGTDTRVGVKAYQTLNQARLKERWLPTLQAGHYRNGEHVLRARDRARNRLVVLVIDHYAPEPDRDAGSRTMTEFIRALQARDCVVKFWPENRAFHPVYTRRLQQMGVETLHGPWPRSFDDWLAENGEELDLALLSRPTVAGAFVESIRRAGLAVPIVYYGHDLHFERMRSQAMAAGSPALAAEADAMEARERALWRKVDVVLYPSEEEAERVRALEPAALARPVLPYCFETFAAAADPPPGPTMIFVAGFAHAPNVDAALWLAGEILPLIRRELPNAKLALVGSNPTAQVLALAGEAIEVTGSVSAETLAARYREARLAVVPLRFGAGVKLKVVESMQMGTPLVTTSVGAQGLPELSEAVVVEDQPEAFAGACVRLLHDDAAWRDQAARQTEFVRARFSVDAMRDSLWASLDAALATTASARLVRRGAAV